MTVLVRSGSVAGSRRYAFELVKPSSVVVTGSGSESATISALGSVEFANATSLSLNDVFSSDYDNYMVVVSSFDSGSSELRLRASGTDNTTASSYVVQLLNANSTTISGARGSDSKADLQYQNTAGLSRGFSFFLYGPALAQPTAGRSLSNGTDVPGNTRISDHAFTHNQSTAYDGFTLLMSQTGVTSRIAVYGMRG